jgi:hypothetical protein
MNSPVYEKVSIQQLTDRISMRLTWILHLLFPRVPLCISDALQHQVRLRALHSTMFSYRFVL